MASEIHFVDENPIPNLDYYTTPEQFDKLTELIAQLSAADEARSKSLSATINEQVRYAHHRPRSVLVDCHVDAGANAISFEVENPLVTLLQGAVFSPFFQSGEHVDAALELPRFMNVTVPWSQIKAITTVVSDKRALPPGVAAVPIGSILPRPFSVPNTR